MCKVPGSRSPRRDNTHGTTDGTVRPIPICNLLKNMAVDKVRGFLAANSAVLLRVCLKRREFVTWSRIERSNRSYRFEQCELTPISNRPFLFRNDH